MPILTWKSLSYIVCTIKRFFALFITYFFTFGILFPIIIILIFGVDYFRLFYNWLFWTVFWGIWIADFLGYIDFFKPIMPTLSKLTWNFIIVQLFRFITMFFTHMVLVAVLQTGVYHNFAIYFGVGELDQKIISLSDSFKDGYYSLVLICFLGFWIADLIGYIDYFKLIQSTWARLNSDPIHPVVAFIVGYVIFMEIMLFLWRHLLRVQFILLIVYLLPSLHPMFYPLKDQQRLMYIATAAYITELFFNYYGCSLLWEQNIAIQNTTIYVVSLVLDAIGYCLKIIFKDNIGLITGTWIVSSFELAYTYLFRAGKLSFYTFIILGVLLLLIACVAMKKYCSILAPKYSVPVILLGVAVLCKYDSINENEYCINICFMIVYEWILVTAHVLLGTGIIIINDQPQQQPVQQLQQLIQAAELPNRLNQQPQQVQQRLQDFIRIVQSYIQVLIPSIQQLFALVQQQQQQQEVQHDDVSDQRRLQLQQQQQEEQQLLQLQQIKDFTEFQSSCNDEMVLCLDVMMLTLEAEQQQQLNLLKQQLQSLRQQLQLLQREVEERQQRIFERIQQQQKLYVLTRSPSDRTVLQSSSGKLLRDRHIYREEKCCICLEDYKKDEEISTLLCGHMVHTHCLRNYIVRYRDCPFCRQTIIFRSIVKALFS